MFSRSHIVSLAAAFALTGSAWAQPPGSSQPPTTGNGSYNGSSTGATRSNLPGDTGSGQPDQMDPYFTDKEFVKNVAESTATEVELGKFAQDRASSDAVKQLGKQMIDADTQTGQQLKQAATALKIELSGEPPRKAKKAEDKLAKLSGSDFDRAYAKLAAEEQKQTVKQFEREAKDGKVQGMKDFAAKNLPAEQERQKQAEELASAGK
jgi:putative membrane protein